MTGIKPTYGRVSRYGMIAFASSLDQAGVLARSAEDAAAVLQVMAGFDPLDSTSIDAPVPDYPQLLGAPLTGLRIGLLREFFDGLDSRNAALIHDALKVYTSLGASTVEVSLPHLPLSVPTYYVVAPAECSSNLSRFDGVRYGYRCDNPKDLLDLYRRSRGEGFGPEVKRRIMTGTYVLSAGYFDAYYLKAQKVRRLINEDFRKAFSEVDVLIGPTTPTPAFAIGAKIDDPITMYLNDIYTIGANLAGLPGLSLPCGFVDGLPMGLQLIGPHFHEARLLNAAHQYQLRTDWHRQAAARVRVMADWEVVIGLEIHAQLATRSKIFSGSATAYGAPPNTQANLVDLAYPGVLPVLNAEAVRMAVKFGLAIGARIAPRSVFARKNYFYPDLPKGYQISQYELPVVSRGSLQIVLEDGTQKTVGVTRAHLEEDAGKSLHEGLANASGIDLNRAGTPLLEIVSEPDMRSAKEAVAYMKKIHTLVRYLEICDGNMQEGSFRCDANVSVRPRGQEKFGTRAEIKNLNSFRFVEKAIQYEVARQIEVIESGGKVVQETRLYDSDKDETRSMRSKEEANDYRYFPDPDLLPVEIEEGFIAEVRRSLPELPDEKAARFAHDLALSAYDAGVLSASRELGEYFEAVLAELGTAHAKLAANWVMGELSSALNRDNLDITRSKVLPADLKGLLSRIVDATISGKIAKDVFEAMWSEGKSADQIIEVKGLKQITDSGAIESVIDCGDRREPEAARRLPRRQGQAVRLLRRPGHEGDGREGQSGAAERPAEGEARRLIRCMITIPCIDSCSSTIRFAATWFIWMPPGGR